MDKNTKQELQIKNKKGNKPQTPELSRINF